MSASSMVSFLISDTFSKPMSERAVMIAFFSSGLNSSVAEVPSSLSSVEGSAFEAASSVGAKL